MVTSSLDLYGALTSYHTSLPRNDPWRQAITPVVFLLTFAFSNGLVGGVGFGLGAGLGTGSGFGSGLGDGYGLGLGLGEGLGEGEGDGDGLGLGDGYGLGLGEGLGNGDELGLGDENRLGLKLGCKLIVPNDGVAEISLGDTLRLETPLELIGTNDATLDDRMARALGDMA